MSLGLSLTAATKPFQLLVSCPESHPGDRVGTWGSCGRGRCYDGKVGWELTQLLPPPLCPQACGPTVHQTCRENVYLTGFCFFLAPRAWQFQRLPSALQGECSGHQDF